MTFKRTCFVKLAIVLRYLALSAVSFGVIAQESRSPDYIAGVTLVDAEGVIELIEKFDPLIVVDSRIPGDRLKGYIESSVSLPDTETNCETLSEVIPNKTSPALFYCNGVKCGRSAVAVTIAKECGYTSLYWFRGGFEVWLEKGLPYIRE